ncbi:hypothetical protein ARMGADRAFT_1077345 [Armillaria gallica]|uniref:Uncharacterized protein n=1 Tax=Armillaria gallica TaxID=47427 RepID=A0A2H3DY82_ARMGA|nr:hypothetical protein ARMGADRAFT_1077345 [Armillaria gallica]
MDSSCIDCQQPLHHIKMSSHPTILSIRDALRNAGVNIPELPPIIGDLNTTKEFRADELITFDQVVEANDVAVAASGYFAYDWKIKRQVDLITKMYHTAVESAYCNATFFRDDVTPPGDSRIRVLEEQIGELKIDIDSSRDLIATAESTANNAQIAAENAQIAHQNSRRGCAENFRALKKVRQGSGVILAQEVRRIDEHSLQDTPAPEVGSTPPGFDGQIAKYIDEDILKTIVFYNNQFGIIHSDELPVRINKFQSFLSGYGEM